MKSTFKLRPYQQEAVDSALDHIDNKQSNGLIVGPTGSGKSLVVSGIADTLNKEILILQPSKEILQQNVDKLKTYVSEDEIGIYSASFKRRDINKYTFATIQSVYKKPELFEHIETVLLDEAHQFDPKKDSSMFNSFLSSIGNPVTIGLTATPFRLMESYIVEKGEKKFGTVLKLVNRVRPQFWDDIIYKVDCAELVNAGHLMGLTYIDRSVMSHSNKALLNKSRTDFNLEKVAKIFEPHEVNILNSISKAQDYCRSILVFCSTVEQSERYAKAIKGSKSVSGDTPQKERDEIINTFKDGTLKVVFNVGVMTTGFDCPELDCIYLLRPTRSLPLYNQILGRGSRTADGKTHCYVLDYSGTFKQFGAIEDIYLRQENDLWELYANGQRMHGKMMYEKDEYITKLIKDRAKAKRARAAEESII